MWIRKGLLQAMRDLPDEEVQMCPILQIVREENTLPRMWIQPRLLQATTYMPSLWIQVQEETQV